MRNGLSGALRAAIVLVLSGVAVAASGAPLTIGNIVVSGSATTVNEFTRTGSLVQTLPAAGSGITTGMCFDAAGNLLVTQFGDGTVIKYNATASSNSVFITAPGAPEACVRDAAGNFYVTSVGGVAAIRKYSSAGALLQSFLPGTRSDWLDLAADQCTMYWDDEGSTTVIHRFNVCTGTALTPLGGNGVYTAIRVLPGSGDILVANEAGRVERFSPAGTLLGSWTPTGLLGTVFSLNLDPDGTTFWTADTGGKVYHFPIATFSPELSSFTTGQTVYGLTVVGEITSGGGGGVGKPATVVPTLSQWALIGLALLLAAVAALRLHRGRRHA
jgi:hypothetical protein